MAEILHRRLFVARFEQSTWISRERFHFRNIVGRDRPGCLAQRLVIDFRALALRLDVDRSMLFRVVREDEKFEEIRFHNLCKVGTGSGSWKVKFIAKAEALRKQNAATTQPE